MMKNTSEAVNPLIESTTSLPLYCGSFSNSFMLIPPVFLCNYNVYVDKKPLETLIKLLVSSNMLSIVLIISIIKEICYD